MTPSPVAAQLPGCTVQVVVNGVPRGSGFFVAPGLILTCAHVVKGGQAFAIRRKGTDTNATLLDASPTDYPDLAVLEVADRDQSCVLLDARFEPTDAFYGWAYAKRGPTGSLESMESLVGKIEGWSWAGGNPDNGLIKFSGTQVVAGMSGSPMLNLATGGVCGVISHTRSLGMDLGGYAVPVAEALNRWPEHVAAKHNEFHRHHSRWLDARVPASGDQRRSDDDQVLRKLQATLEALQSRLGTLPPGVPAEIAASLRKRWATLQEFVFLLRDYDTPDEITRSIRKIQLFIALGVRDYLAGGRFDELVFVCRLKHVTVDTGERVVVLHCLTHRPEALRPGKEAYRQFLQDLDQVPFDPARYAERMRRYQDIQEWFDRRLDGWGGEGELDLSFDKLTAVRVRAEGARRVILFAQGVPSTDVMGYRHGVTTTSEALRFLASLGHSDSVILEAAMPTSNLALMNLYLHLLDERQFDLGRVLFNVDQPEEWNYNYDPQRTHRITPP